MREKSPRLIVTFHTTAGAIATEQLCRRLGLAGKLISVPPVHHIRLRHGLVRAAGAAGAPGDPAAGGRDRDSRFL